jgi:hypothetical protein
MTIAEIGYLPPNCVQDLSTVMHPEGVQMKYDWS